MAVLLFVSITFVCTAFPVVTVTRWICEGRVCNISFGINPECCCTATYSRQRDNQCVRSPRYTAPTKGDVIACADGCGCKGQTMSMGGDPANLTAKATAAPEPLWATIPTANLVVSFPVATVVTIAPNSVRGPPVASSCPRTYSLRAPPAA